ncbi:hypothetical protein GOP47_0006298 [Adiantum capillus-veneris]|uniref:Uncharacterized protein n=1 Tax=Adiantum capillus-veneris TaxID=13818 RepID=A0A9D4V448_ADICA|nr:hypothetical protein GOP47_0006298 [Adiantum capillus-veneris]
MTQLSGERALALLEDITSNAESAQHTILSQILSQNSNTEYLRGLLHRDGGSNDSSLQPHTFKRIAPLTCYEDIQPYIQRIADGDKSPILADCPVRELLRSSGTSSGKPKFLPAVEGDSQRRILMSVFTESVLHRDLEGLDDGKEGFFQVVSPRILTTGGVLTQSLLTSFLNNPEVEQSIRARNASPIEVVAGCEDVRQSTYCQLLCALRQRQEVVRLGASFACTFLHVMYVLKNKWRELVEDIRTGSLNEAEVVDSKVRKAMERQIKGPDPPLAMQVEKECCRQPLWQGIVRRLWPRAKCVACVVTGSMEQYIPMLEFFCGGLPLVSSMYGATEGVFGINMDPLCSPYEVSYVILPNMAYCEFLPLDSPKDEDEMSVHQSQLVDLVDVKLGHEYDVVVTTFAGLYRYRVGDCLQVTGFYNKTPQFRIVGRKNVVLSVATDKTDEATLQKAIQMAMMKHLEASSSCQLVDYTSFTDVSMFPGHYVLFWEVDGKVDEAIELSLNPLVMRACCDTIEECLDTTYKRGKAGNWIGPLEIRVVRQGTFHCLMEYSIGVVGVSLGQYKTPRVVKLAPLLELLNSRVSHCFYASNFKAS